MQLALGTMTFGREAGERESRRIFEAAYEGGIRIYDTAPTYGYGASERILGDCLASVDRTTVRVMTKWGYDAAETDVEASLEGSMARLRTDYIDTLFCHRFGCRSPVARSKALEEMRRMDEGGLINYIGLSNCAAWQVAANAFILAEIAAIQPMYSLVKRQAEVELLPVADDYDLTAYGYSPLGSGVLVSDHALENRDERYKQRYMGAINRAQTFKLMELANRLEVPRAAVAVAWVALRDVIPIIGASNVGQLNQSLQARRIKELPMGELDEIFPPPPPAHDRPDDA